MNVFFHWKAGRKGTKPQWMVDGFGGLVWKTIKKEYLETAPWQPIIQHQNRGASAAPITRRCSFERLLELHHWLLDDVCIFVLEGSKERSKTSVNDWFGWLVWKTIMKETSGDSLWQPQMSQWKLVNWMHKRLCIHSTGFWVLGSSPFNDAIAEIRAVQLRTCFRKPFQTGKDQTCMIVCSVSKISTDFANFLEWRQVW